MVYYSKFTYIVNKIVNLVLNRIIFTFFKWATLFCQGSVTSHSRVLPTLNLRPYSLPPTPSSLECHQVHSLLGHSLTRHRGPLSLIPPVLTRRQACMKNVAVMYNRRPAIRYSVVVAVIVSIATPVFSSSSRITGRVK